jgi:surface polysaccharide O-acyltransferase-like enzyme
MVNGNYKPKRIIDLWLQVVFYSYFLLIVVLPFKHVSLKMIITSLLPTLFNEYWYFNSYLVLFLFIPLLNRGIKALTKSELFKVILFMFMVLSVLSSLAGAESLYVNRGYSPLWLIYLYVIGAYIKLFPFERVTNNVIRLVKYLCLTIVMFLLHDVLNIGLMLIKGGAAQHWSLLRYSFPVILLMAIYLFVYLINLQFTDKSKKIITFVSRHSFAAYLLQTNILVFSLFLKNMYGQFISLNTIVLISFVIINALIFYVVAVAIDKFRVYLFKLLRIKELVDSVYSLFTTKIMCFLKPYFK